MAGNKPVFAVTQNTLAKLKAALKHALGRERYPHTEPVASQDWLRVSSQWQRYGVLSSPGSHVVIGLRDGRTFVGKLLGVGDHVSLAPWSWRAAPLLIPLGDVYGAAVVGPHAYRDEAEARARQRRGEPAATDTTRTRQPNGADVG